jgi:hypothetical protein
VARPDGPPGQQKTVTIRNEQTGEEQTLTKADLRARRQELRDAGWSGPGLTDEVEELEEGSETGETQQ